MSGIAGILKKDNHSQVEKMLDKISHRGKKGRKIIYLPKATLGIIWSDQEEKAVKEQLLKNRIIDGPGFGQQVSIDYNDNEIVIYRDELGVTPLYFAKNKEGILCFASEVKALLHLSDDIQEFKSGHLLKNGLMSKYFELELSNPVQNESAQIATELKKHLEESISRRINGDIFGSWLSGGLDSSIIAALARPFVNTLFSFTAGTKDASDIIFAKEASKFIGSKHKEIIVDIKDMIRELPEVIYHLESFDALLVRSSILNYFVAKIASDYVAEVFSGEAGDEFFAGYLYLKSLPEDKLDLELIHISKALHNTAFQRVDRSASAHGIKAHVVFADPQVFNFALTIPKHYKIFQGVEKWILRQAGTNILPETILCRTKAKFWEGSGIGELLYNYAEEKITDQSFLHERKLENGWSLNSKEELMYYRIFKETYGGLKNLDWMGRSKKA